MFPILNVDSMGGRLPWFYGIFVKPNFQNQKNFFLFFFFNSISTYIQCATRRLSLCDIRKYRFPAFYGTFDRQAAIFFWTRMIQTWSSFSLMDPCSIFFCSSVKPKFFTPTHEIVLDRVDCGVTAQLSCALTMFPILNVDSSGYSRLWCDSTAIMCFDHVSNPKCR